MKKIKKETMHKFFLLLSFISISIINTKGNSDQGPYFRRPITQKDQPQHNNNRSFTPRSLYPSLNEIERRHQNYPPMSTNRVQFSLLNLGNSHSD